MKKIKISKQRLTQDELNEARQIPNTEVISETSEALILSMNEADADRILRVYNATEQINENE